MVPWGSEATICLGSDVVYYSWLPYHFSASRINYTKLSYPRIIHTKLSYPILSSPILSYHVVSSSYRILSYPIISYPLLSSPILCYAAGHMGSVNSVCKKKCLANWGCFCVGRCTHKAAHVVAVPAMRTLIDVALQFNYLQFLIKLFARKMSFAHKHYKSPCRHS